MSGFNAPQAPSNVRMAWFPTTSPISQTPKKPHLSFKVCTLLNWSQVSVQVSPGCLRASTPLPGRPKAFINRKLEGTKKGGHDGRPFKT